MSPPESSLTTLAQVASHPKPLYLLLYYFGFLHNDYLKLYYFNVSLCLPSFQPELGWKLHNGRDLSCAHSSIFSRACKSMALVNAQ